MSIFLAPWSALDDAGLLAHFRGKGDRARNVRFSPVLDADETQPTKLAAIMAGRFEFNGETHALPDPIDWLHNPSADIEWHILLHKFYYAPGLAQQFARGGDAAYAHRWMALTDGWMRNVPAGFIAADVTGRRVQNWIYAWHGFVAHAPQPAPIDPAWHRRFLESLHEQVEHLCAHLTPKRNHRTLELLAILLAGVVFPEMKRAAFWREFALHETAANMQADLLDDGVHCEQSTDYHHLALKNWLNARRLAADNGHAVPREIDACLERALEFSLHVHKPDGIVPSLSDGDARGFLDLLAQGAALLRRADMRFVATRGAEGEPPAQRAAHFASSGYTVLRSGWDHDAQYLVFDTGPLGEGNHGHFDALNFELAAHGRSLIVDPGRFTYSEDTSDGTNWRVHFRGTAAHNTVCVDGKQQTRYEPKAIKDPVSRHPTGSVRHKISGEPARARLVERFHAPSLDVLHGEVRSSEYDAVHQRCFVFVDRRWWIVSDWLRADSEHDYTLNFQLNAHAQGESSLSCDASGVVRLQSPGLLLAQPPRAGVQTALAQGWVSARYGHKQAAPALKSRAHARNAEFDTVLVPSPSGGPTLHALADVGVESNDGRRGHALRIELETNGVRTIDHWFHCRGVDAVWRVGPLEFRGRWLCWRERIDGTLLRAISHAGASLLERGELVALATDAEVAR